ncbi:MAG: hypothetical protein ACD_36C00150G0002 [uncultured bacterium]|nr:MAG: hypothetical protein ACD_36C00150G0002 [uncultured bacterium]
MAPLYEAIEFGIADKFIVRAIAQAYNNSIDSVTKAFKKAGDVGTAAESLYRGHDDHLSIEKVYDLLFTITQTSGIGSREKKIRLLAELLSSVGRLSSRYLTRIPLDKLRLGFSDMTILDALSWMLNGNKSARVKLEEAYNVRPDIGYLAKTIKEHGMKGLSHVGVKVGAPILACLCQRLPNADEMIKKMGRVAVEPKYDGVRVQIHYQQTTKTFSRNLENTTDMFPELQNIGKQLNAREVILDSEAIGLDPKTGKLISFQETTTRKRKHDIAETLLKVPLKFFVFDILYKNGESLLSVPFSKRRRILEETIRAGNSLVVSEQIITDSAAALRVYHDKQLKKGLEGAVVKKWDSPYEPGRRGYTWVKFKEEEGKTGKLTDTIDAVVMGYTSGEGKRTAFGIGQVLLGVRRGDDFVTVTKLGSGATEKELGGLFQSLKKLRMKEQPKEYKDVDKVYYPDVWVSPKLVLEIAGDDLTKSKKHGAGYSVRFPRLVRIRPDKSPHEVTTVKEVETLFKQQ